MSRRATSRLRHPACGTPVGKRVLSVKQLAPPGVPQAGKISPGRDIGVAGEVSFGRGNEAVQKVSFGRAQKKGSPPGPPFFL